MNATHARMITRWQDILNLASDPISAYKLSVRLGLNSQFGIRDNCNSLIAIGYLKKIDIKGQMNKPALLYQTIKPVYDASNFEADMILVRAAKEKANGKKAEEEIPPNHRRFSSDDYHTRGHVPKRSAWIASSLQAF